MPGMVFTAPEEGVHMATDRATHDRLVVPAEAEWLARVSEAARRLGCSREDYVRQTLTERMRRDGVLPAEAAPVPAPATPAAPPATELLAESAAKPAER